MADIRAAMAEVFEQLDTDTLCLLSSWQPPVPRHSSRRHGRVTVRMSAPDDVPAATRQEMLQAAAANERNWSWGNDEQTPRAASAPRHYQHN